MTELVIESTCSLTQHGQKVTLVVPSNKKSLYAGLVLFRVQIEITLFQNRNTLSKIFRDKPTEHCSRTRFQTLGILLMMPASG